MVEHLLSKHEAQSSNPNNTKGKNMSPDIGKCSLVGGKVAFGCEPPVKREYMTLYLQQ
jgi:hypothetical protein